MPHISLKSEPRRVAAVDGRMLDALAAGACEPLPSTADISGPLGPGVPDGCVDAFDLAKLLAAWCSVAGGNPCGTCL